VPGDTYAELVAAFHAAHEQRYGHRNDDEPVELVNVRLIASVPGLTPSLAEPEPPGDAVVGHRQLLLPDGDVTATVLDRTRMGRGSTARGPAVVELPESTCLVRPGWSGYLDDVGTLVLERT
jgi:N-methylhydantoinase A